MTFLPLPLLYNQKSMSDEDFVAAFVARGEFFDRLLNVLRRQARGGDSEHHLIVGQRGMGKSTLLRRIAIGVMQDEELRRHFIPLQFREEQYNVLTLATFWRNCGDALAEWCDRNGREAMAARIDRAIERPEWREADPAANAFLALCREIGGRPVLLVDNLDLILDALDDTHQWTLRRILQMADGPVVIGAATHFINQSGDRDAAFYEFFHPHLLEPLGEEELMRCVRSLADRRGPAGDPVRRVLATEPQRLRTLYALTGGNPRVLALIYQIIERSEGETTFADLEALLDQVTPFYKARVEEYATAQQRAVIDAIALNWDPILSRDLAAATGIAVTTISTHLDKLRKEGFVQEVETSGARSGYQIAERFLNIWYLMRHGTRRARQKLLWLTKFLSRLYTLDELDRMAAEARDEATCRWHPYYREAVLAAYEEAFGVGVKDSGNGDPNALVDPSWALSLFKKARIYYQSNEFCNAIILFRKIINKYENTKDPFMMTVVSRSMLGLGIIFGDMNDDENEINEYDLIFEKFGNNNNIEVRKSVAMALFNKGNKLISIGRGGEAISAFNDLISRFAASEDGDLVRAVVKASANKGRQLGILGRIADAITAYDEAVLRASNTRTLDGHAYDALIAKGSLQLDVLEDGPSAEAAFRAALDFWGNSPVARSKIVWTRIMTGQWSAAQEERAALGDGDAAALALIDAGIAFAADNFGVATGHLDAALADGLEEDGADPFGTFDDLLRVLRLAEMRGYGEKLIGWFGDSGHADRYAPVFAAFVALVRGERFLLDVNPEVRRPAQQIFERLSAPRRHAAPPPAGNGESPRPSRRPRRRKSY